MHPLGERALELRQARLLRRVALRPGEVDELLVDEPLAEQQPHAAARARQPPREALQHAPAVGPGELVADAVAAAGDRARDELERVARARAAEGGLDLDLPPLARPELGQRALEHLEGDRGPAGGVAAVVAQDVLEREPQRLAALGDLEHAAEYRASIRWDA